MINVAFNDLPQAARARFAGAAQAVGDPRVLHYSPLRMSGALVVYGLMVAFFGLFELALVMNLLDRGGRVEPSYSAPTYFLLAVCTTLLMSALFAIAHRFAARPRAYRDGYYGLTTSLVKAELGQLTILPMAEVGQPQVTHFRRNGAYSGSSISYAPGFVVQVQGQEVAVQQVSRVLQAKEYCARVLAARDAVTLQQIDVFHECTMSNQWSQPGQLRADPWGRSITMGMVIARTGAAAVIGILLSGVLYASVDILLEGARKEEQKKWPSSATPAATPPPPPTTPKRR